MAVLARHCTRHREKDPVFRGYGRPDERAEGMMPDLSDRRVGAVVAVAPVGALFGDGAFTGVDVPAQIHRLEGDRVLRRPWHEDNIVKLMGGNASLVRHPQARKHLGDAITADMFLLEGFEPDGAPHSGS